MGVELKSANLLYDELIPEEEMVWRTFVSLSKKRSFSDGAPRPISMEAIGWYIDLNLRYLTEDEVEDLQYLLDVLDDRYVEMQGEKAERARKSRQKGSLRVG